LCVGLRASQIAMPLWAGLVPNATRAAALVATLRNPALVGAVRDGRCSSW